MLNGFAGLLAGFNGKWDFESGAQYPADVKYGVMRCFNAFFGAMVSLVAYGDSRKQEYLFLLLTASLMRMYTNPNFRLHLWRT